MCSKGGQDAPESAKMIQRRPEGSHLASKMGQDSLVGIMLSAFGDHVGSCWSLGAPLGHLGGDLGGLGVAKGQNEVARNLKGAQN